MHRRTFTALSLSLCCAAAMPVAHASDAYPNKPIKVLIGYPPGGGTDIAGRAMAQRIQDQLKGTVFVENRPGAGGGLATVTAARAAPDGYTFVVGGIGTQIANRTLFPDLGVDPMKDLDPVANFSSTPLAVVVSADSPIKTVADLVKAGKTEKGLIYGSGGAGSATHLSVVLFGEMAGAKLTHVPYKGSSPANVDLVSARLDFMIDILSSVKPLIDGGRLRMIAVTSKTRLPQYPNVPALAETPGLGGYESMNWTGLFAPKGTDPKVIKLVSDALNNPPEYAAFKAKVDASGATYTPMPSDKFTAFLKEEYNRWNPIAERELKK